MIPNISQNSKYLLSVISAVLEERQAPPPPDGVDFSMLFTAANAHLLAPMVYHGIYSLGLGEDLLAPFLEAHRANVRRSIMQETQAARVFAALEEHGVDYCPLKGWFTRGLYPEPSMRVMSDVDILIRPASRPESRRIMEELGYSCIRYDITSDDKYKLAGLLTEFHIGLDSYGMIEDKHYSEPFSLAVNTEGHAFRLIPEEEYFYTIVHALKHFMNSGVGIRVLIDIFLYITKGGIDRNKVRRLAEEAGILRFLECLEKTALAAFGHAEFDEDSAEILKFMLGCGAGGTTDNYVAVRIMRSGGGNGNVASYMLMKIFPPKEEMRQIDPIIKKHPALLPFCHVKRWFRLIFKRRDRIESSLTKLSAVTEEDKERIRRIHSITGIKI